MIITDSMVKNSIRTLMHPADGSNANKQARDDARTIVEAHIETLQTFAALKPDSGPAQAIKERVNFLESII